MQTNLNTPTHAWIPRPRIYFYTVRNYIPNVPLRKKIDFCIAQNPMHFLIRTSKTEKAPHHPFSSKNKQTNSEWVPCAEEWVSSSFTPINVPHCHCHAIINPCSRSHCIVVRPVVTHPHCKEGVELELLVPHTNKTHNTHHYCCSSV